MPRKIKTTVNAIDANEDFMNKLAATIAISPFWNNFVNDIKYRNRFFHPPEFSEIIEMLFHCKKVIKKDLIFYRARQLNSSLYLDMQISVPELKRSGIGGVSPKNMKAPPEGISTPGRANPAGISYLYLASKPQIACAEIQPTLLDLISVGQFKINKKINVINLKDPQIPPSLTIDKYIFKEFITCVELAFSHPIRNKIDLEYAPSQYISAYAQSKKFDGIVYGSMNDTKHRSYNLVLFDPTLADLIESETKVYQLRRQKLVFQNFSVLSKDAVSASCDCPLAESEEIKKIHLKLSHLQKK